MQKIVIDSMHFSLCLATRRNGESCQGKDGNWSNVLTFVGSFLSLAMNYSIELNWHLLFVFVDKIFAIMCGIANAKIKLKKIAKANFRRKCLRQRQRKWRQYALHMRTVDRNEFQAKKKFQLHENASNSFSDRMKNVIFLFFFRFFFSSLQGANISLAVECSIRGGNDGKNQFWFTIALEHWKIDDIIFFVFACVVELEKYNIFLLRCDGKYVILLEMHFYCARAFHKKNRKLFFRLTS